VEYYPRRYKSRDSLKDPKAQVLKAETSQADRFSERLAQLRQEVEANRV
jgi:hypothetical protein